MADDVQGDNLTSAWDFPGKEFYDYYESVTLTCSWPGCGWTCPTSWDEDMNRPFVEHFQATHGVGE